MNTSARVSWISVIVIVVGLVVFGVLGVSHDLFSRHRLLLGYSRYSSQAMVEAAFLAADAADFPLARELYAQALAVGGSNRILGATTDLEEAVFPEKVLERRLLLADFILSLQPTYRDALALKSALLHQLGRNPEAVAALKQIEVIDPNYPELPRVTTEVFE